MRIHEFRITTIDKRQEEMGMDPEEREVPISIDLNEIEAIYQTWGEDSDDQARLGMKSGEDYTVLCPYREAVRIWKTVPDE